MALPLAALAAGAGAAILTGVATGAAEGVTEELTRSAKKKSMERTRMAVDTAEKKAEGLWDKATDWLW